MRTTREYREYFKEDETGYRQKEPFSASGVGSLMPNVWAQVLMIAFSILYGIISYRFRYWGEMMTYLGMSLPMAVWSMITWVKNPSSSGRNEVAVRKLTAKQFAAVFVLAAVVTAAFYFLLAWLDTPNIVFSTVSVTTSFLAASLTMLRSSYYALGYAANDLVLCIRKSNA